MAALAALDPGTAAERATRAGATFAAGKVGQKAGGVIADKFANRAATETADLAAQKAQNAVRDTTMAEAQKAGYVLPPSQVNPTTMNRLAEGFAGKLTTAQNAAAKNQTVTNKLIAKEIGLPPEAPITLETIRAARAEAGKAYEPVRQFGPLEVDAAYAKDLDGIASKYDLSHGGMTSLRNAEVERLLKDATQPRLDSNVAVEMIRELREQGFANAGPLAKAAEKKLGKTQLGIANALENQLDRKMAEAGSPEALAAFREARVRMAKTYTAEKALNPATGNIEASKLGAMFKKDKPLTGGFATVGRTAAAFPAATKEITTSLPQVSPLDYVGGMMMGGATGSPLSALTPLARPLVRSAILSKPFQGLLGPNYDKGALGKALETAGNSPEAMKRLGGLLGVLGLQGSR
jgi:histone H3/H4